MLSTTATTTTTTKYSQLKCLIFSVISRNIKMRDIDRVISLRPLDLIKHKAVMKFSDVQIVKYGKDLF